MADAHRVGLCKVRGFWTALCECGWEAIDDDWDGGRWLAEDHLRNPALTEPNDNVVEGSDG